MNYATFLFLDVPYCSCLGDTAIKKRPICFMCVAEQGRNVLKLGLKKLIGIFNP